MASPARKALRTPCGFTLVELMVVVLIILLVSAAVIPTILPAIQHRQVSEAARLLQGGLVQARAAAAKANAPRGIRLLPDPTYANSPSILAFNRWVPIEPGPDYASGQVTIWPVANPFGTDNGSPGTPNFVTPPTPPAYTYGGGVWPYYAPSVPAQNGNPAVVDPWNPNSFGQVLMIEESPFVGNNINSGFNNPTSWFWSVRVGDKIQIGDSGASYTVVGPMLVNPTNGQNPELFVNDGPPGQAPQLIRQYTDSTGQNTAQRAVEYLYVVNSLDDDHNGFVDDGWDGYDNNYNASTDELIEWETEKWQGATQATANFSAARAMALGGGITAYQAACANAALNLAQPLNYTISRRPVPSPGARETSLPTNVVIDATTWNTTGERSRLPIDANSKTVDVLLNPTGQAVLTTQYSSPTSLGMAASMFHFWLSERQDVREVNDQRVNGVPYLLSMPTGASYLALDVTLNPPAYREFPSGYPVASDVSASPLKGERRLLTLFSRTGKVSSMEQTEFNVADFGAPFREAQSGFRGPGE